MTSMLFTMSQFATRHTFEKFDDLNTSAWAQSYDQNEVQQIADKIGERYRYFL